MNDLIKEAINSALNNPKDWRIALLAVVILVIIGLFTGYLQKIIDRIFIRKGKKNPSMRNSPYIKAGHSVTAGGDIIVGGSKTQLVSENFPTVVIKPDGFTHNTGRLDLIFENTGQSTAVIKELKIGENNTNMDEFSLSPGQKARKQFNVSGFEILEEKKDTPNFKLIYRDFSNNKRYKTVGNISQEPRADGKYNLGKINEISFLAVGQDSSTSNLEKQVLEKLYAEYRRTGQRSKWKAVETFKELGIKDGQDISTLHDSKFVKVELDNTHECFVITSEGIKYMDNQ